MDRNPQAREMADESMVRNLASQAAAIWPQEAPIFAAHALPADARILDVGCGTGEIAERLATMFPRATIVGIDLVEPHLARARDRCAAFGERVRFQTGDAFELPVPAATFDLVVCRHVLQAVPTPELVLADLVRVAKPGAVLHLIPEDYDMIHGAPAKRDVGWFWHHAPRAYARATGCDLHIGRNIHAHLHALRVTDIRYHYVHVDTLRVPRETVANIFVAWRDGYVPNIATYMGLPEAEVRAYFDAMIDCVRDPASYAVWSVPVVTAKTPSMSVTRARSL